jgi:hypothetical protein
MFDTSAARADQVRDVERTLDKLDGFWSENFDGPSPRNQLRGGLARLCTRMPPPRCVSREEAARHEAGHFAAIFVEDISKKLVAHEADRFAGIYVVATALSAKIFDHGGGDWRGTTTSFNTLCPNNPHDLIRKPAPYYADHSLKYCSTMWTRGRSIISRKSYERPSLWRAAELSRQDRVSLWQSTTTEAAAFVEHWASEISDIAGVLTRRKVINASDRPIARILARILAKPFAGWGLSPRCIGVLGDIRTCFSEFEK